MYEGLVPDLLQAQPKLRVRFEPTKFAIALAFAGNTSGGLFSEALEQAEAPPSTWDPQGFAKDMFLSRLVGGYFRIRSGAADVTLNTGYLLRLVSRPPSDDATIDLRRDILRELAATPALRRSLDLLYQELSALRGLLENSGGSRVSDATRQRLDTLTGVKRVIDRLAADFAGAKSSLSRLSEFGAEIRASEPYRALEDLLGYDAELANLSLNVSVGADGRIRSFAVVRIEERKENPFVAPVWQRWLAKLELFVRGYRFSQDEVMARLVDSVFGGLEDSLVVLVQLMGDVEFYLGALGFRDLAEAAGLAVCLPDVARPGERRELFGLFNPLLLLGGVTPVPCDLIIEPTTSTTLITGPNSGGKTRLLQSVGLSQLLSQCGLFVPARAGKLAPASGLVASLIEGIEADQAEGRLGTELLRIRSLFEKLPPHAMVLLDELCSGTNPSEGERIFELVLGMLHKLAPQAFITTHFLSFAGNLENASKVPGLSFVQVELGETRRPTYQFVPGVAKTSLAEHTAERLGVTGDQLLGLIEQNLRRWDMSKSSRG